MAKKRQKVKPLPTLWEVPDALWEIIQPILSKRDPPAATGAPRIDQRKALNGVIHQMRSGCQWNQLPKQFGDDSSIHRTFQRWVRLEVLDHIWAMVIYTCDELGGVDFQWQSADGAMGKARFGGTMSGQTPRIGPKTARNAA